MVSLNQTKAASQWIKGNQFRQAAACHDGVIIETPDFINTYTGFQNLKFLASINGAPDPEQIQRYLSQMGITAYQHKRSPNIRSACGSD
ncbi:ABC transporter ATPase [Lacticaseibacillus rhamnosus MTCC 5462]|nr:ABC transporter ATPase [Lacticaseibacillus rhamnosus MTCC 5462]